MTANRTSLTLVAATGVALGIAVGLIWPGFIALARSGGVSDERVLAGPGDPILAVLRRAYDLRATSNPDLDIGSVGECTFAYTLESDHRGIARVDFSGGDRALRVRFYDVHDDTLSRSSEPSFTASLFTVGRRLYVYDEFRGRLLEVSLDDLSSYREVEAGVKRAALAPRP
jgi:hypothetical protein